ncbi:hypothetical protein NBRC116188_14000 [Oceaniserpentilla sp. 4NH20-0058]|uniref:ATP-grasp domain-containing protein n=1 Tax=Oceaniserpentilla sp. 4NH20-0058 TaxID=3127660 RepID=UPI0031065558
MNILFTKRDDWQATLLKACKHLNANGIFDDFNSKSMGQVNYVFPIGTKDVIKASDFFEDKHKYPSIDLIRICENKLQFDLLLNNNELAHVSPLIKKSQRTFPYVLKEKTGEFGNNVFIIQNPDEEALHQDKLSDDSFFLQKYIKGEDEYALHFLFDGEKFRYFKEVKYEYGYEFAIKSPKHVPVRQLWADNSQWKDEITNILKSIKYRGIGCLNYKIEANQLFILELNPRIGGSMMPVVSEMISEFIRFFNEP